MAPVNGHVKMFIVSMVLLFRTTYQYSSNNFKKKIACKCYVVPMADAVVTM